MAIKIKMDVVPFPVPDDVKITVIGLKQDGPKSLPTFPLSALDYYGLDELCRDFRREVFKKAKIHDCHPDQLKKMAEDDSYGK